ncbi:hypothetical protein, partial [Aetokthonos hydrillicola]|uniref:hypothetical protein n=1 Tax=Aetokthonos hydrillicola TaxID=1550245 RepID=UPI001ABA7C02
TVTSLEQHISIEKNLTLEPTQDNVQALSKKNIFLSKTIKKLHLFVLSFLPWNHNNLLRSSHTHYQSLNDY